MTFYALYYDCRQTQSNSICLLVESKSQSIVWGHLIVWTRRTIKLYYSNREFSFKRWVSEVSCTKLRQVSCHSSPQSFQHQRPIGSNQSTSGQVPYHREQSQRQWQLGQKVASTKLGWLLQAWYLQHIGFSSSLGPIYLLISQRSLEKKTEASCVRVCSM